MNQRIIISTTNFIDGMEIEKYYDLISTNVVLGTNVFSDIGASFSDFFGGSSEIYQNKLERIYKVALDKLRQKAKNLNANGIIGVNIDFDEVSGGGKSMFMISVSGMAVRLKSLDKPNQSDEGKKTSVTPEELENVISRLKIITKIKSKIPLQDEDWEFLLENTIEEILPELLDDYLFAFKDFPNPTTDIQRRLRKFFPLFLKQLDFEIVSKMLYEKIQVNNLIIITLLKESESFNPELTLTVIKSDNIHQGISSLVAHKRYYSVEDLKYMNSIVEYLKRIPKTGKIEVVKGILVSKEKFICENNHSNDIDAEFCTNCGKNIQGLTKNEINILKDFELKIQGLAMLLN
ncbi:YbjQ family protein [Aquiflexum gelatinilyticum]|uniref:YbjQ family protein n=1 Tax=Aquiflexum gelatinilyticum TaxID=2961943 RepID=UPI002168230C|nr:YbjQ family protein [Aquiflexum gelatinilyticum]MCS4433029.1 YbjQ family protein [Aquiflexum gelatinilyticum]